jgi:two-component system, LytTR family, sensor kinase
MILASPPSNDAVERERPSTSSAGGAAAAPFEWRTSTLVAIGACAFFGLLETANVYLFQQIQGTPSPLLTVLRGQAPWWSLWMVLMPITVYLARTFRFEGGSWLRSGAVHVVLGLGVGMAHVAAFGLISHFFLAAEPLTMSVGARVRMFVLRWGFQDFMTYIAVIGAYNAFDYFSRFRRSAMAAAQSDERAAKLQLSLAEARLHALRMELHPHFLFNALNAVAGLVRKREHDAAIDMLAQLGELLRTTLNREMPAEVPLAEELAILRRFVEIEMVRFGDRLRVTWEVEQETSAALVPPLILQPLVENALRHGISRRPGAALLRISARRVGLHLELAVRDTGEGLALRRGGVLREGIGLSNTRARLEQLYGPDATSLELADVPGGGAVARLLIPFHLTSSGSHVAIGA